MEQIKLIEPQEIKPGQIIRLKNKEYALCVQTIDHEISEPVENDKLFSYECCFGILPMSKVDYCELVRAKRIQEGTGKYVTFTWDTNKINYFCFCSDIESHTVTVDVSKININPVEA